MPIGLVDLGYSEEAELFVHTHDTKRLHNAVALDKSDYWNYAPFIVTNYTQDVSKWKPIKLNNSKHARIKQMDVCK